MFPPRRFGALIVGLFLVTFVLTVLGVPGTPPVIRASSKRPYRPRIIRQIPQGYWVVRFVIPAYREGLPSAR
jgi:hypothetical protein